MDTDHNASPVHPLPWVVWVLALPIALIEIGLSLGGDGLIGGPQAVGWRLEAYQQFAFSPQILHAMIATGYFPASQMLRFVSYMFIHGGPTHAIFVVVFILAMGKYVSEVFRPWAVLVMFFGSGIMGALIYGLFANTQLALIGGYPPVYGLIGGFSFILWVKLGEDGGNRMGAFSLIAFFLGFQLLFGLIFGGQGMEWVADLAGFLTGFGLSFLVCPGGPQRALALIRRR